MDKEVKPVAYFVESRRGLVLNGTKYTQLSEVHGTRDVNAWVGSKVRLYKNPAVRFQGKVVGGLEIDQIVKAG